MMRHFRSGEAIEKGVVVWKYSRFSRDVDDAAFYRSDLRRLGYLIHSLNDNIPEGPEGRFFEAAIDWMNQRFLEDLSTDVRRGLRHLVQNYGCVPGVPPMGFKREEVTIGTRRDGSPHIAHRWIPDPEKVPLIRKAFEMRASGLSLATIHKTTRLYSSLNSYRTFFGNRIYLGILEFGDLTDRALLRTVYLIRDLGCCSETYSRSRPSSLRCLSSPPGQFDLPVKRFGILRSVWRSFVWEHGHKEQR